jgi:hypothetical protein
LFLYFYSEKNYHIYTMNDLKIRSFFVSKNFNFLIVWFLLEKPLNTNYEIFNFCKIMFIDLKKFHLDWLSLSFIYSISSSSLDRFSWTNSRLVWRNARSKDACVETRSKLSIFHPRGRVRIHVVTRREMSRHPRASERTRRGRVLPRRRAGRARFPFSILARGMINKLIIVAVLIGRRGTDEIKRGMRFQRLLRKNSKTIWNTDVLGMWT